MKIGKLGKQRRAGLGLPIRGGWGANTRKKKREKRRVFFKKIRILRR